MIVDCKCGAKAFISHTDWDGYRIECENECSATMGYKEAKDAVKEWEKMNGKQYEKIIILNEVLLKKLFSKDVFMLEKSKYHLIGHLNDIPVLGIDLWEYDFAVLIENGVFKDGYFVNLGTKKNIENFEDLKNIKFY